MEDLLNFLAAAKTQYHAVRKLKEMLDKEGFKELNEEETYELNPLEKYYIIRNSSSIMAFKTPKNINDTYLKIVASHTDSPTLKVKPNNKLILDQYSSLNVEVYGGPIYSSFFDRPLSLAGRAYIKKNDKILETLVDFDSDLLVIPNECIHFNREVNSGKNYNAQIDLIPLLGNKDADLNKMLAANLKVREDDILSFDLQVYNRYRGSIIGANKEYFMAPQIDNLESAYLTLKGFLDGNDDEALNIYVSFDNEEVGSSDFVSRIRDVDFLIANKYPNEIQIINDVVDKQKYKRVTPSYVICFDTIDPKSLEASKSLNIPIVLIDKSKYKKYDSDLTASQIRSDMYYTPQTIDYRDATFNLTEDTYQGKKL